MAAALMTGPAVAHCSGPYVEHAEEVVRGGELFVEGNLFGYSCDDTGRQIHDIEVVFRQDGRDFVVAEGDAATDLSFRATVVVPVELQPGEAELFARWNGGESWDFSTNRAVAVSDTPPVPVEPSTDSVATFDSWSPPREGGDALDPKPRWSARLPWMIAAAGLIALATLVVRAKRLAPKRC